MSQISIPLLSPSSLGTTSIAVLFIIASLIGLYFYLLPKPIPGTIPYNKASSQRLFGDIPDLISEVAVTENPFSFLSSQLDKLRSPIAQIWMNPFSRPIVVVSDPATFEDVLLRRTKEFDRSKFIKDVFEANAPHHHFLLRTNDQFKAQRRLISDAISPAFLRDVGAVRAQESAMDLVELWRTKAKLSKGKAFSAKEDLKTAVFDAIWSIATGENPKGIQTTISYLRSGQAVVQETPSSASFPTGPLPEIFGSIHTMAGAFSTVVSSPMPRLHHHFLKLFPKLKAAYVTKDRVLDRLLEEARGRYAEKEDEKKKAAVDWFLYRDKQKAEKTGQHLEEGVIRDEVLGFLQAGHETTATTLTWTVKFLATYPEHQSRLRSALQSAFPNKTPTSAEIESAHLPYFSAFVEESLRCSQTSQGSTRTAMVDTELMGHFVPKGTEVFFMTNGAGYVRDSLTEKKMPWERPDEFMPERWLDAEGRFDQQAGPVHLFGLGLRGCWGKKLAYIEMRSMVALLTLNFEFEMVPLELSGSESRQAITNEPRKCYVKLKEL